MGGRMKFHAFRGSHLPVLIALFQDTTGPVLELGMGFCSTPFLHWGCFPTKRRLVSYENSVHYYDFARAWEADFHEVHCIEDWDKVDLTEPWSLAFVDHQPNPHRVEELKRLTHAEFVVIHDTENSSNGHYGFNEIRHLFRYRWKYTDTFPYTSIWSNKHDIRSFSL